MPSPMEIAIMLKGRLEIENKINNGDFANGTDGWAYSANTSGSVNGNIITITHGASDPRGIFQILPDEGLTYLAFEVKSSLPITRINLGAGQQAVTAVTEEWNRFSRLQTFSGTTRFYADAHEFDLRYPLCIKLTPIFGTGNEPTQQEMDELIKVLGIPWFAGKLTVMQKQITIWLLNLMRQNRNAIIALGGTIT